MDSWNTLMGHKLQKITCLTCSSIGSHEAIPTSREYLPKYPVIMSYKAYHLVNSVQVQKLPLLLRNSCMKVYILPLLLRTRWDFVKDDFHSMKNGQLKVLQLKWCSFFCLFFPKASEQKKSYLFTANIIPKDRAKNCVWTIFYFLSIYWFIIFPYQISRKGAP